MLRTIAIVAALLVPTVARAEFVAKKSVEMRPTAAAKVVAKKVVAAKADAKAEASIVEVKREEPLTIDSMLGKINTAYMMGMQRCYMKGLRQDPTLGGKVTVVLTVGADGRVSGTANGIAAGVDRCLTSKLSHWRFSSPRDRNDNPTDATFKISLLLRQ